MTTWRLTAEGYSVMHIHYMLLVDQSAATMQHTNSYTTQCGITNCRPCTLEVTVSAVALLGRCRVAECEAHLAHNVLLFVVGLLSRLLLLLFVVMCCHCSTWQSTLWLHWNMFSFRLLWMLTSSVTIWRTRNKYSNNSNANFALCETYAHFRWRGAVRVRASKMVQLKSIELGFAYKQNDCVHVLRSSLLCCTSRLEQL